jgi:hypothetical protein
VIRCNTDILQSNSTSILLRDSKQAWKELVFLVEHENWHLKFKSHAFFRRQTYIELFHRTEGSNIGLAVIPKVCALVSVLRYFIFLTHGSHTLDTLLVHGFLLIIRKSFYIRRHPSLSSHPGDALSSEYMIQRYGEAPEVLRHSLIGSHFV